ncbi:MAG: hypothetical protein DCC43_14160 [Candidatus Brocadia sp.]|uniref:Amino acid transporter protein n=1 Tax=Candidatus Brocadia fulgida TaxID=380242 RepID=A0A0M2UWX8_9BACT|nr:MAG: amino acid transporter protein [Candidatus Brocadia fulgida]MCC6325040.1 amino acid permease [Candidatus Brocadia sp.]MCE7912878.1 amino acid permease [Candidatus Brocadia sp. AMX3]RIJ91635.1 MAG: hypothetical protein DCC43_14160 [Candidatus Brocadia sp.]UJS19364.1 MAG: APC family permease [Candidatus Brocadia sp.]
MQNKQLRRELGLFDVACLGVNSVVGAGIFLLPGHLSGLAGREAVWVFPACGVLCFAIALCFAELGGMYHATGGAYLYAREAFGPFAGFLVGWMMWLSSIIGWASVASGFSLYAEYFLPAGSSWMKHLFTALLIGGLSAINYFGIKPGSRAIHFFVAGKLLPLFIFICTGLFFIQGNDSPVSTADSGVPFVSDERNFPAAIIMALYAYSGFESIAVPAGEMKHPRRDIPRVLFFVLMFATGLYVIIQIVATGTFPVLASSDKPLADAAHSFMGKTGGILIGAGALLSMGGVNAGIALTSPRSLYVLSADGFLPRIFSRVHRGYHTPCWAILLNTVLTLALSLTGSFKYLLAVSVMVSIIQYIPACLAVIVLRRYQAERARSYRIPGGHTVPVIGLAICGWLTYHVEFKVIAATALAMALSLPFYFHRR